MSDVTKLLAAMQHGDHDAGDELLRLVYEELRRLARAKMAREQPGHTLQPTALVHEAWLKLGDARFESRAHFFGAAAQAMRRILIDSARRKQTAKHGAGVRHENADEIEIEAPLGEGEDLLAIDDALDALASEDPRTAELVKLRFFAGMTIEEAADVLGISQRTATRDWSYARAWLFRKISSR